MTSEYQLTATDEFVIRNEDRANIPNDGGNIDWQQYQGWLTDGGVPDPYVAPPDPGPQPLRLEAHPEHDMDAATLQSVREVTAAAIDPLLQRMAEVEQWLRLRPGASADG